MSFNIDDAPVKFLFIYVVIDFISGEMSTKKMQLKTCKIATTKIFSLSFEQKNKFKFIKIREPTNMIKIKFIQ